VAKPTIDPREQVWRRGVRNTLKTLQASSGDLEATALISSDGRIIESVLGDTVDPDRFAAMCASLLALADQAAREIGRGSLKQVLVEGNLGTMLLVQAGEDAVLAVASQPSANLGMVFLESKKRALELKSQTEHFRSTAGRSTFA